MRAGARVDRHVIQLHILVNVVVTAGNAVVAIERAAVQSVRAVGRRIDRRAEVAPPLVVRGRCVRRVRTTVHRDRRRRRRVVRPDRRKVRRDRRAIAVFCSEDCRAAVQHVHTVHAVGTSASRRQCAILNGQLAAINCDQRFAVEVLTVRRSGDLTDSRDRQIASGRDRE